MQITVTPAEVRAGDYLIGSDGACQWRADYDADVHPDGTVTVDVQYLPDGGYGVRAWDKPARGTFTVDRAGADTDIERLADPHGRCQ